MTFYVIREMKVVQQRRLSLSDKSAKRSDGNNIWKRKKENDMKNCPCDQIDSRMLSRFLSPVAKRRRRAHTVNLFFFCFLLSTWKTIFLPRDVRLINCKLDREEGECRKCVRWRDGGMCPRCGWRIERKASQWQGRGASPRHETSVKRQCRRRRRLRKCRCQTGETGERVRDTDRKELKDRAKQDNNKIQRRNSNENETTLESVRDIFKPDERKSKVMEIKKKGELRETETEERHSCQ